MYINNFVINDTETITDYFKKYFFANTGNTMASGPNDLPEKNLVSTCFFNMN